MIHLIKRIIAAEPFELTLQFNTGEIRTVNLAPKLSEWSQTPDSAFKDLLDADYFVSVQLNEEMQSIYWENGIDLCPDVLYQMSQESKVALPT